MTLHGSNKLLRELEEKIVGAFIDSALAAGYRLTVSLECGFDNAELKERGVLAITDKAKLMEEAFSGDDCHIFVHEAEGDPTTPGEKANPIAKFNLKMAGVDLAEHRCLKDIGWVYCVMGNDDWDVINDYTSNKVIRGLMVEANKIADQYS